VKLLLDQNLSYRLVPVLQHLYPDIVHVRSVGLADADDDVVLGVRASEWFLAMRGAPARAIQELAGHQDLPTTERHMHLSPAAIEGAI
jgi:hypothetical protein